jgi:hypothetical protein
MQNKIFHRDVGIPPELLERLPDEIFLSSFSNHAKTKLEYYGLSEFYRIKGSIIEVEVSGRDILKVLVRKSISKKADLVVAIGFKDTSYIGFVKTLWVTAKHSCQRNLNRERYYGPREEGQGSE